MAPSMAALSRGTLGARRKPTGGCTASLHSITRTDAPCTLCLAPTPRCTFTRTERPAALSLAPRRALLHVRAPSTPCCACLRIDRSARGLAACWSQAASKGPTCRSSASALASCRSWSRRGAARARAPCRASTATVRRARSTPRTARAARSRHSAQDGFRNPSWAAGSGTRETQSINTRRMLPLRALCASLTPLRRRSPPSPSVTRHPSSSAASTPRCAPPAASSPAGDAAALLPGPVAAARRPQERRGAAAPRGHRGAADRDARQDWQRVHLVRVRTAAAVAGGVGGGAPCPRPALPARRSQCAFRSAPFAARAPSA
eukprot:6073016-Prymnesium_polylepis.1